ncbi:hypothetical protein BDR26DRAFT_936628 [Obelidium mucronatum]|nr:hypothetical protein BDR26DRAFT_936628 [Obelidium mucronatum]
MNHKPLAPVPAANFEWICSNPACQDGDISLKTRRCNSCQKSAQLEWQCCLALEVPGRKTSDALRIKNHCHNFTNAPAWLAKQYTPKRLVILFLPHPLFGAGDDANIYFTKHPTAESAKFLSSNPTTIFNKPIANNPDFVDAEQCIREELDMLARLRNQRPALVDLYFVSWEELKELRTTSGPTWSFKSLLERIPLTLDIFLVPNISAQMVQDITRAEEMDEFLRHLKLFGLENNVILFPEPDSIRADCDKVVLHSILKGLILETELLNTSAVLAKGFGHFKGKIIKRNWSSEAKNQLVKPKSNPKLKEYIKANSLQTPLANVWICQDYVESVALSELKVYFIQEEFQYMALVAATKAKGESHHATHLAKLYIDALTGCMHSEPTKDQDLDRMQDALDFCSKVIHKLKKYSAYTLTHLDFCRLDIVWDHRSKSFRALEFGSFGGYLMCWDALNEQDKGSVVSNFFGVLQNLKIRHSEDHLFEFGIAQMALFK